MSTSSTTESTESDRLLVQRIRSGDEDAWSQIIDRYEGRLLAYVNRRLQDRQASEDVVQETFVGFHNSLPGYDENKPLQTYLFTIASFKLTDHLRKTGRHPLQLIAPSPNDPLSSQLDRHLTASSGARQLERQQLESLALGRCLRQVLNYFRDRGDYYRIKVLELLFVKGWTNKKVAIFLELDEQKIANIRFDALKRLREYVRTSGLSPDVFPDLYPPDPDLCDGVEGQGS